MRDIEKNPYTKDEARVAEYICEYGIGGGDDPIGFLIASHRVIAAERKEHLERDAAGFSKLEVPKICTPQNGHVRDDDNGSTR